MLIFTTWKLHLKNSEKTLGNLLLKTWENDGNIMEFCQSGKVGTLIRLESIWIVFAKILSSRRNTPTDICRVK